MRTLWNPERPEDIGVIDILSGHLTEDRIITWYGDEDEYLQVLDLHDSEDRIRLTRPAILRRVCEEMGRRRRQ
jgi:hypothetical protein